MFGESGAPGKNCIWSAALTQWRQQKRLSSNMSVAVGLNEWWILPRRPSPWTFTIRTPDTEHAPMLLADALHSRSRSHAHITHRTSRKAELFCEIRMMRRVVVESRDARWTLYDCWLFAKSMIQPEGEPRKRQIYRSPFF
jgi:hypothetical protein